MKTMTKGSSQKTEASLLLKQHLKQYKTQKEAENSQHYALIKQLLIDRVNHASKQKQKLATQLLKKLLLILKNER